MLQADSVLEFEESSADLSIFVPSEYPRLQADMTRRIPIVAVLDMHAPPPPIQ